METRDMAEVVETFRTKFMEGAAGIADRVAGACAGLVARPGGMALHDMELEPEQLVGGVLDSLSAAAVTEDLTYDVSKPAMAWRWCAISRSWGAGSTASAATASMGTARIWSRALSRTGSSMFLMSTRI